MRHVIVAERDVIPLCRRDELTSHAGPAVFHRAAIFPEAGELAMGNEDVESRAALGAERRRLVPHQRLMRHGEHGAVEPGEHDAARVLHRDLDTERLVQPEDRARLGGARGIVVAGDYHDG